MYSEIVDGQVLDYHFKPLNGSNAYNFSVGDLHVGQIFKLGGTWTAVTNRANPPVPHRWLCHPDGRGTAATESI